MRDTIWPNTPDFKCLKFLGLQACRRSGDEIIYDCPACGKEEHLYFNIHKLVFDCKACEASGHYLDLLGLLAEIQAAEFTPSDRKQLAKLRGIRSIAFKNHPVGLVGSTYCLHIKNFSGRTANVLRWKPGGKSISCPGGSMVPYRCELLREKDRRREPVYITEGPWDCIALEWVRRTVDSPGVVIGVLGAGIFKPQWAEYFRKRDVITFYDNDHAGAQGEAKAHQLLTGIAKSVRHFNWKSSEPDKMDVRDLVIKAFE